MNGYEYTDHDGDKLSLHASTKPDMFLIQGMDKDGVTVVGVPNEDAPAVALAILEAAGIDGGQSSHAHHAVRALHDHEAVRAAEAEREAEDAKAVAFWAALNPGYTISEAAENIGVSDRVRDQYRAAREFFKENP